MPSRRDPVSQQLFDDARDIFVSGILRRFPHHPAVDEFYRIISTVNRASGNGGGAETGGRDCTIEDIASRNR